MLAYEVQIAHEAAQRSTGKPRLLPVRVDYTGPLPEPLCRRSSTRSSTRSGRVPQDDDRLVAELLDSAAQARPRGRAVAPGEAGAGRAARCRWTRRSTSCGRTDDEFRAAIARRDSIVLVKGARQMGKTSLLARGLQQAREAGARVVLTDFQMLNAAHLESAETLLPARWRNGSPTSSTWTCCRTRSGTAAAGASVNFERYLRREVLGRLEEPLVWGLDEVDRLFACDFGSEVFGLFRSWHNERALDPDGPWSRLTLAIAYATEAHLFITDLNQSPFNVGTRLTLEDFTLEQVADLNRRYGAPLRDEAEVGALLPPGRRPSVPGAPRPARDGDARPRHRRLRGPGRPGRGDLRRPPAAHAGPARPGPGAVRGRAERAARPARARRRRASTACAAPASWPASRARDARPALPALRDLPGAAPADDR